MLQQELGALEREHELLWLEAIESMVGQGNYHKNKMNGLLRNST
jgi:hypothetical protein